MTKYHATLGKLADLEGYDDVGQHFECRALDSCVPGLVKSVLKIARFNFTQSGDWPLSGASRREVSCRWQLR
jgi:hypothetical protein